VLIASSSADEESQESDDIGASFFTHYWLRACSAMPTRAATAR